VGAALAPLTLIEQEARALMTRLQRVRPFSLLMPMVPAAGLEPAAQSALEDHMWRRRGEVAREVTGFIRWIRGPVGKRATPEEAQRKFTFLRLRFNAILAQQDIFANVLNQRSEHGTGEWLSGMDVVAKEALALPGYYEPPPVICYLDRGHGAAIRRARTRLPGGEPSPVAIIRVPRERMVGSGIASSLIHEVGHQGAHLLDLVESLRPVLQGMQGNAGAHRVAWQHWEKWISEIVADLWAVAKLGIVATTGLLGVVSLPKVFVFQTIKDDPHPTPWVRVMLSCAMGHGLYPHPQWAQLARSWESYYPLSGQSDRTRSFIGLMQQTVPGFVAFLLNHRPPSLRGRSLKEVLGSAERLPANLIALFQEWQQNPRKRRSAPPSLAFAVFGQARAAGLIGPEHESHLLGQALTYWALKSTLDMSYFCTQQAIEQSRQRAS
jgi:hypothetical protein